MRQAVHEHRQTYSGARTNLMSLMVHLTYETKYIAFTREILIASWKRTGLSDPNSGLSDQQAEQYLETEQPRADTATPGLSPQGSLMYKTIFECNQKKQAEWEGTKRRQHKKNDFISWRTSIKHQIFLPFESLNRNQRHTSRDRRK